MRRLIVLESGLYLSSLWAMRARIRSGRIRSNINLTLLPYSRTVSATIPYPYILLHTNNKDIQNVAVEIPDIDGPNDRGLLRRIWFPLAMTEAATMYAVLLMAASHYCIVNPSKAALVDLLHLKARALSEINAALTNPKRAITDSMIGAVMKMAAYEAIFGDSAVFNAHMKGLQMMLKIRGGLSTLGLNGLLERMLVWIDLNAAHLTGMPLMIGGEDLPTGVSFAAPDPYHFAGIS